MFLCQYFILNLAVNTMALREVARYSLPLIDTALIISRGSVLHFDGDVIVNAANVGCLNGGGVDGAITSAGGVNLARDRLNLPILGQVGGANSSGMKIRCQEGDAVLTGPNDYGPILPSYIIHAVGPNFHVVTDIPKGTQLLRRAYTRSLDIANQHGLHRIGFSLLSAGVYRGPLRLNEVLGHAVDAIEQWAIVQGNQNNGKERDTPIIASLSTVQVKEIHLCAFTEAECTELTQICDEKLGNSSI